MDAREQLRLAIDEETAGLRALIPAERSAAILTLLRTAEAMPRSSPGALDPVFGIAPTAPGLNLALRFCVETSGNRHTSPAPDWPRALLSGCERVAIAEQVLFHTETGFMRLLAEPDGSVTARVATRQPSPLWYERADFDWWLRSQPDLAGRFDAQFGYPPDAILAGAPVRCYREVVAGLVDFAESAPPAPVLLDELIAMLGSRMPDTPETIESVLACLTLDPANAAYHSAVPGIAAAPLIRLDDRRVAYSRLGLAGEPLLFAARELRRRDAQAYHNSAVLREGVFRSDLYALFNDRRFVTAAQRMTLRRAEGNVRTDIDAAIFDRKTGTLALFELKSQDPFARSSGELHRQRDNVLYANRQLSGTLDWIKRHGADEILQRIDRHTAKTFRAQRVLPFVLGRYLVHFNDGAEPDRRAAWGTWPQLLRLLAAQPIRGSENNPLASLFTRLRNDPPAITIPVDLPSRRIDLGGTSLTVYPSHTTHRAGS